MSLDQEFDEADMTSRRPECQIAFEDFDGSTYCSFEGLLRE